MSGENGNLNFSSFSLFGDRLTCFKIKDGEYLLFSPFSSRIGRVDEDEIKNPETVKKYKADGYFGEPIDPEFSYEDMTVGMVLTTDCNLRCIYCFAEGGRSRKLYLSEKLALRTIEEAVKPETKRLTLYLTGGEPTLNPEVVMSSIRYAQEYDLPLQVLLYTNGIIDDDALLDQLMAERVLFHLSVDGIPSVQNHQRPLPDGGKSSEIVEKTIRQIVRTSETELKTIATVTQESVATIGDSIEYLAGLGVTNLQIETFSPFASDKFPIELSPPDVDAFVSHFVQGLDTAKEHGMKLIHSSYENILTPCTKYCQAKSRLVITPDGYVTPCYTVTHKEHPYADAFFMGKYSEEEDQFEIDFEKVEQFFGRTTENTNPCQACFIKYLCSGGCINRAYTASKSFRGVDPYLCRIRKRIVPQFLYRLLLEVEEYYARGGQ